MRVKTEEEELLALKDKLKESNTQATNRIRNEFYAEKREDERKNAVMGMFFILTGKPMTLDEYNRYIKIFDNPRTPAGYSIASFIRDEKIAKEPEEPFISPDEYLKKQLIDIQADKILEEYKEEKK